MIQTPSKQSVSASEQRYQAMHKRVATFRDKLDNAVDSGIFESVVLLNLLEISTLQSCEGHLDHGSPYPWVTVIDEEHSRLFNHMWMRVCKLEEQAKAKRTADAYDRYFSADVQLRLMIARCEQESRLHRRLTSLLDTFYEHSIHLSPFRLVVKRFKSSEMYRLEPGFAEIPKDLPDEFKPDYLERAQAEMQAFTAFLKERFFAQHDSISGRTLPPLSDTNQENARKSLDIY